MTSKDLLKVSLILTLSASASTAFASPITGTTQIGNGTFTPSANVAIEVVSGTSSYAATSQHLSGDRIFFGSNSDPKIYYTTKATGSTTSTSLTSTSTVPTSWSSL